MAGDLVESARRLVTALEHGDLSVVRAGLSDRLSGWDAESWIVERWGPQLDEFAGQQRKLTGARQISEVMARVSLVGDRGQAFVSVLFDDRARVAGLAIDQDERDGRFWIVVGCTREEREELKRFYSVLTAGPIGYGEGGAYRPRWPSPEHPAQIHFDIAVADLEEAEREVVARGATKLAEFPTWRVYADPVGHPFCLYPELTEPAERIGTLSRVVIDCADPAVLANFWAAMLDMPRRLHDTGDRIVIAGGNTEQPMVALQRIPEYRPPRWPDPEHPAQMHFDIGYDDRLAKERLALRLGAGRLPAQGGSCPVYADPAGHPFCLCYKGE